MRAHIVRSGLLLGVATAGLTAAGLGGPVAWAADDTEPYLAAPGELLVPGQELQIQGYCPDPAAGALTSDALTDIQILHDPASGPPNLNASGVVAEGTAAGVYPVTMDCAGQELRVTLTVTEPEDSPPELPADFVGIYPAAAAPGETVTAQARCDSTSDAVLRSPVLRAVTLAPDPEGHQPWAIHGTTTVTGDAEPGEHPVSMQCGEGTVQTTITVLADKRHDGGHPYGDDGLVSRVPRGAPETGEGSPDAPVPLLAVSLALGIAASAAAIARCAVRR